ncbi:2-oxo acid dehydrogenase subunit E2 [Mycolicibacterium sp. YH-1]|uniref:2-oxo acid dehydrogenase subunit E2 n=1 Tax=Mycolicibacterium sp. YH-1 TaxID=2908837 RepID=UPI001F4C4BD8|nr:2-oxo acid dehydrogenase subunit E2 [Mycolicibacterium sp. YH-1]UNB50864.1 2-oxo acid dehydrogenase subunit E2 [Mycolicibacterium sp. YH-1]
MSETRVTISLPTLGEDITEATISRWLVSVGDDIDTDEPLLEVATDKVDTEIPSPVTGTVVEVLVEEDESVEVGARLAVIAVAVTPSQTPPAPTETPSTAPPSPAVVPLAPQPSGPDRIASATPSTAAAAIIPAPGTVSGSPQRLPRIRQIIAARMLESLQTSAQLTSVVEVDVTAIGRLRAASKSQFLERTGVKLSFLPFFARAVIEALAEHPVLSATVNPECTEITYFDGVDLGIAVDSPKGLMVPVVRGAHQLGIPDLSVEIAALADQVRVGSIPPDALVGGTFTLTNTGSRGALFDTPILNAPQSGILGTGAVVDRVVPQRDADGNLSIGVRSMVYLALTYDHRIVDGADAARFLTTIKDRLESGFTAEEVFATTATRP